MKIISVKITSTYKEIVGEIGCFFWKRKVTYRRFNDGTILEYKDPDHYYKLGGMKYYDIKPFFSTIDTFIRKNQP